MFSVPYIFICVKSFCSLAVALVTVFICFTCDSDGGEFITTFRYVLNIKIVNISLLSLVIIFTVLNAACNIISGV